MYSGFQNQEQLSLSCARNFYIGLSETFSEHTRQKLQWKFPANKLSSEAIVDSGDLQEFYATADLTDDNLQDRLDEWQHFYNWHRSHSSLGGKTPIDRCLELSAKTPFRDEVEQGYDPDNEPIREQNYRLDLALRKLK